MIVGEAPGRREDDSGRPFVGQAGQLLREILEQHGFNDKNAFITNAVSCRPPDNRTPSASEIKACRQWVQHQIEVVKPKYVLLLGNVPMQSLLGLKGIKKLRGKPVERDGITYLPTYHPAYILRDPTNRPALEADVALFASIVENCGILEEEELNEIHVLDMMTFKKMLKTLKGTVSFDLETSGLYPWCNTESNKYYKEPVVTAMGFGTKHAQWTIPIRHYQVQAFSDGEIKWMIEQLTDALEDCFVVAHNGKFDLLWMKVFYGVNWHIDFDTMIAHYLLDENSRHGLKILSQVYCGARDYDIDPVKAAWGELAHYHCLDLLYTRKLRYIFGKMLFKEGNVKVVFDELMMPCSQWFTDAEFNGVYIDMAKMDDAEVYLREEIAKALGELDKWGPNLNWRSTQQVSRLLFDELGLSPLDYTKKGAPSVNESVIQRLDHPLCDALLKYRGAAQQLSFFIEGWKPFIVKNRLHPSFKMTGTVTGRPSCEHPNLQQTPRDSRIRSLIIAPPGWELLEWDLSQIELRLAAEHSGEQHMLDTFYAKRDIHWQTAIREISRVGGMHKELTTTARKILGHRVDYDKAIELALKVGHKPFIADNPVWKDMRKKAKAINFGYLYGMWWRKFIIYARDNYGLKVTEEEAKASRVAFFELYPGLVEWHERQKRYARRHGYVTTLTGRKRRLPAALSRHDTPERKEAERQAINSPIQGFAAELNLMGALQVTEEFGTDNVRGCGTIHDATLAIVRKRLVPKVATRVLEIMRKPKLLDQLDIRIRVPIEAEVLIGPWGQGVSLEQWLEKQ